MCAASLLEARKEAEQHISRYWEAEQAKCANKIAVIVEGDDDKTVIEAFLARRSRRWSTGVHVVAAGGRTSVLSAMGRIPGSFGVVDRDAWDDKEVDAQVLTLGGRLFVTAGWCLENSLIAGGSTSLPSGMEADFSAVRDAWVKAGALWWSLQRARDAFNLWQEGMGWTYGRPRPDLDTASRAALLGSLRLLISTSAQTASNLDLDAVLDRYEARLGELQAVPPARQWLIGVHGKRALNELVLPKLVAGAPTPVSGWRAYLATQLQVVPEPLDALLAALRV